MTEQAAARPWLDPDADPAARLRAHHSRFCDAVEEYVTADMEARDAGRRKGRALNVMAASRHAMAQLAAEHNLPLPSTRFAHLLDAPRD